MVSQVPVEVPVAGYPTVELVAALESKVNWTLLRTALKQAKLPVGLGWKALASNAEEATPEGSRLRKFLSDFFDETIIAGERYVQIYSVEKSFIDSLLKAIEKSTPLKSEFSEKYPLPLDLKSIRAAPSSPTLCEIRNFPNGDVSLVFCAAGYFDDRNVYESNQLSDLVKKAYDGIDRLITVRKTYYQSYDVITVRRQLERIEISVDQPSKLVGARFEDRPMEILTSGALHFSDFVGFGAKAPDNLFPAMSAIYTEPKEGRVVFLAFRTLTGSIKRERMTRDDDDLRDEIFHQAGMEAVGQDIKPYELEAEWNFKAPDGVGTVKLHGLISQLASQDPTLHGCYVKAHQISSFERTLNRLMTFTSKP